MLLGSSPAEALVDKWRELVVVVFVHYNHLKTGVAQTHGQFQSAQSASHDNHSCEFSSSDIGSHRLTSQVIQFIVCHHCQHIYGFTSNTFATKAVPSSYYK